MSRTASSSEKTNSQKITETERRYFSDIQRRNFQEFIRSLETEREITTEDFKKLEEIYTNGTNEKYHHYYSDIGSVLSVSNENALTIIGSNLQEIQKNYKKQRVDIKNEVEKLYDHAHIKIAEFCLFSKLKQDTNISVKNIEEKAEGIKTEIETKTNEISKNLEKSKIDYITILGIFASIVIAFVGSFAFSASVLTNMKGVSAYRLVGISCLIGFIFVNMIWILTRFIAILTARDAKIAKPCIMFNIIFSIIFLANASLWFYYKYLKTEPKDEKTKTEMSAIKQKSESSAQQHFFEPVR